MGKGKQTQWSRQGHWYRTELKPLLSEMAHRSPKMILQAKRKRWFPIFKDQFPIAPTLPPALYPCIGTPENWAQQTVVCFNASLHCCVPWSSRKHHIPQQKFKRKTLCNPNREGTKVGKKNTWPTFSIFFSIPVIDEVVASNCVNTSGLSVQVGGSETTGCATMCDRPAHLQYYELSQEPRDGHSLKSHILEEKSEIFLLSIYSNHLKK